MAHLELAHWRRLGGGGFLAFQAICARLFRLFLIADPGAFGRAHLGRRMPGMRLSADQAGTLRRLILRRFLGCRSCRMIGFIGRLLFPLPPVQFLLPQPFVLAFFAAHRIGIFCQKWLAAVAAWLFRRIFRHGRYLLDWFCWLFDWFGRILDIESRLRAGFLARRLRVRQVFGDQGNAARLGLGDAGPDDPSRIGSIAPGQVGGAVQPGGIAAGDAVDVPGHQFLHGPAWFRLAPERFRRRAAAVAAIGQIRIQTFHAHSFSCFHGTHH